MAGAERGLDKAAEQADMKARVAPQAKKAAAGGFALAKAPAGEFDRRLKERWIALSPKMRLRLGCRPKVAPPCPVSRAVVRADRPGAVCPVRRVPEQWVALPGGRGWTRPNL